MGLLWSLHKVKALLEADLLVKFQSLSHSHEIHALWWIMLLRRSCKLNPSLWRLISSQLNVTVTCKYISDGSMWRYLNSTLIFKRHMCTIATTLCSETSSGCFVEGHDVSWQSAVPQLPGRLDSSTRPMALLNSFCLPIFFSAQRWKCLPSHPLPLPSVSLHICLQLAVPHLGSLLLFF